MRTDVDYLRKAVWMLDRREIGTLTPAAAFRGIHRLRSGADASQESRFGRQWVFPREPGKSCEVAVG
jgi:hypothetical protein